MLSRRKEGSREMAMELSQKKKPLNCFLGVSFLKTDHIIFGCFIDITIFIFFIYFIYFFTQDEHRMRTMEYKFCFQVKHMLRPPPDIDVSVYGQKPWAGHCFVVSVSQTLTSSSFELRI